MIQIGKIHQNEPTTKQSSTKLRRWEIIRYLDEIPQCLRGSTRRREDIFDPRKLQNLLRHPGGDDPRPTRRGHHAHRDGSTLPSDLAGDGVGLSDLVPPVAPPHGDHRQLGQYDGAANGGGHLLAALYAEADVAVVVADDDEGLEACALSGTCLLLHGHDLHHLVLELRAEKGFDDLVLLDGEGVEVDLLQASDLSLFHQAAELRHGDPLLLLLAASATAPTAATTTAPVAATSTAETAAESASISASLCHCVTGLPRVRVWGKGKWEVREMPRSGIGM